MTSDLGRVTTHLNILKFQNLIIAVTSDLGRVTTTLPLAGCSANGDCGDVRSRTSYNHLAFAHTYLRKIAVTSDLGRVTTLIGFFIFLGSIIAVTSDLGRVTTPTI